MKKKVLSLVLVMGIFCTLLTGCVGSIADVKINADGSGSVKFSAGMTKDGLEMMASMEESAEIDLSEFTPFEYNGTTYYGTVEYQDFANVDEFNSFMNGETVEDSTYGVDSGGVKLVKNSDNSFTVTLTATSDTGDTSTMEESAAAQGEEIDEELINAMLKDFAIVYTFEFPTEVKQLTGPTNGITINGKTLKIDVMKLDEVVGDTVTYTFTTGASEVVKPAIYFTDVIAGAWYYDAVMAMAEGGLVNGIGNNLFNPNGTLTYAQFCQILARAKMLDVGTENGYWAYKAVESCLEAGYILYRGEINSANYDVPIPREAAVAAMFKGKQADLFLPTNNLSIEDIPDFDSISGEYQDDILNAYKYGITNGMDSNKTFNPKGLLTRAQVCQLFYNLTWTNPLADVGNIGGLSSN